MKRETRDLAQPIRLEAAASGTSPGRLAGYAAKFNEDSAVLYDRDVCKGPFIERIRPGAFSRTLVEQPDIRGLANHDTSDIIGRTTNGTLRLWEDEVGLAFEDDLPDTSAGRDVRYLVENEYITGCSFGFMVREDDLELRPGLPAIRTLIDVELYEVSPAVSFPAYEASTVALRSKRTEHTAGPPARPHLGLALARLRLSRD